jgi:hypothetical protein
MCRANEIVSSEENVCIGGFVFKIVALIAVLLLGVSGCMTVSITDSIVMGGINQDKPIRAGVSTTGEAIGEAIKAAGYGGFNMDIGKAIEDLKALRELRNKVAK